jgi:hypothetical protein
VTSYVINDRTAAGALVSGWICRDHVETTSGAGSCCPAADIHGFDA